MDYKSAYINTTAVFMIAATIATRLESPDVNPFLVFGSIWAVIHLSVELFHLTLRRKRNGYK